MAFSDLQLKVGAESAILAAHKNLAKISLFAKSYSELNANPGNSIAVPVYDFSAAADFVPGTNDYGTGTNEVGGVVVTLDKHLVKSVSITDTELAETGIAWMKDTATGLADVITRGVNAYVFGLINETTVTKTAEFDPTSKEMVAELYAVAEDNDIPVDRCVVALTPSKYAKVLGLIGDTSIYGGDSIIKNGVINGLYGFKGFVCAPVDAVIMDEAIGVASRYLAPAMNAYPEAFKATDEDGFTMGFRKYMDLATGKSLFACDALVGAKITQPAKIVRLVEGD